MASKIAAAKIAVRSGVPLVIAPGRKTTVLADILGGAEEGTLFVPNAAKLKGRKRWIAFFHHPKGTLFVDDGARKAVGEKGKSLLPPGVARCEGDFAAGDVVRICDLNGTEFARGIARSGSTAIRDGTLPKEELIHRDDLVLL
jgi:glutamate 5-kinase